MVRIGQVDDGGVKLLRRFFNKLERILIDEAQLWAFQGAFIQRGNLWIVSAHFDDRRVNIDQRDLFNIGVF